MENDIGPQRAGKTDGQLHRVTAEDLVVGSVLRMLNSDGTSDPFSDMVVVSAPSGGELTLSRPYLYASGSGGSLMGFEQFRISAGPLLKEGSTFRVVCTARGNLHSYVT